MQKSTHHLALSTALALGTLACSTPDASTSTGAEATRATITARAVVGEPAPDFELPDLAGDAVRLSHLRGNTVVLEWFNPQCPFVVYAHEQGPLADQARRWTAEGDVVWLAINSGAPGKQGADLAINVEKVAEYRMTHPVLRDPFGEVGRTYGAKNTPQMFIVDAQGILVFAGGLDNAPMGRADGEVRNFVDEALTALDAGRPVPVATPPRYGCSVKYAN
jgi:peroxiredoxin